MTRLLMGSFAFVTMFFLSRVGGHVEGWLFPVTTLGVITQTQPIGETSTRIWGHAERLRQCSFEQLIWYLGDRTHHARADLVFEEGTKVRGDGFFDFGPWVVQLTSDQLKDRSFAVVYHRCHPFWLTVTRFYD